MKRSSTIAVALLAAAALFCLTVGSAGAKQKYAPDGNLNGAQTPGTTFGNDGPTSIDVDENTGNVYVVDPNHNTIPIFGPDNQYVSQIKGLKGEASVPTEWSPVAIAIDGSGGVNDGYVYVADIKGDSIRVFTPAGTYAGALKGTASPFGTFKDPRGVTVDKDGVVWVADSGNQAFVKYVPSGGIVEEADYTFSFSDVANAPSPGRIAVDKTGNLTNANGFLAQYAEFSPTGTFLGLWGEYFAMDIRADYQHDEMVGANYYYTFVYDGLSNKVKAEAPANPHVIGVNETTGALYAGIPGYNEILVLRRQDLPTGITGGASEITNTTATLAGTVDRAEGGPVTGCVFEYGTDQTYGKTVPCDQATPYNDQVTQVTAKPTNLLPGAVYHYRIAPSNADGINQDAEDKTFQTEEPPLIEGFSVTEVQANSATLNAEINPKGSATTYHFEHGPSVAYGNISPIPDAAIGAGDKAVSVSLPVSNLPGTTYHFRVVATNQWGTVVTANQSFDFFPPNCPNAHVRQETASNYLPDCRAYELASPENAGGTTISGASGPTSPFATNPSRVAFTGMFGTIPGTGEPANAYGDLYVSTRTTTGWKTSYVGKPGNVTLSGSGPPGNGGGEGLDKAQLGVEHDPGMDRIVQWDGNADPREPASNAPSVYTADGQPIGRFPTTFDETPGAVKGLDCTGTPAEGFPCGGKTILSDDLGHFVFSSNKFKYLPEGTLASPGSAYDNDTEADTVTLISKNPKGKNIGEEAGEAGPNESIDFPAISADGSRILMSTKKRIWMREGLVTYDVTKGYQFAFAGMPSDGSVVYFTSDDKVTAEDKDTSTDLYMWSAGADTTKLISIGDQGQGNTDDCTTKGEWTTKCGARLIDVRERGIQTEAGMLGSGLTDNTVAAGSGDIYFYSPDQLDGDRGLANFRNLYVYRDGSVMHVAMLEDGGWCLPENVYEGVTCTKGPVGRIQVSPNGDHLAFMSQSSLTAYDNLAYGICDRLGGKCFFDAAQMYTWSPSNREIICVSCAPDGAAPTVHVYASQNGLFLTDDGRAFFSTSDPLTKRDTNGIVDVYEYVDGRAQLISPGIGDSTPDLGQTGLAFRIKPGLIGVSGDGTDVYFATYEVLVGQDKNGAQLKIYDARAGGGIPFVPPPPPCPSADECHGDSTRPPAPLEVGTGARIKDDKAATPRKKGLKCTKAGKKKGGKKACKKKAKSSRRAGKKQGGGK